jgi:hypothetical protein
MPTIALVELYELAKFHEPMWDSFRNIRRHRESLSCIYMTKMDKAESSGKNSFTLSVSGVGASRPDSVIVVKSSSSLSSLLPLSAWDSISAVLVWECFCMRALTLGPNRGRREIEWRQRGGGGRVRGFREAESEHQCAERSRTSGWPRVERWVVHGLSRTFDAVTSAKCARHLLYAKWKVLWCLELTVCWNSGM